MSAEHAGFARATWRYLRLAIVALVGGLAVSVVFERLKVPRDCFQTSISAYYYTPVRPWLIGALIGVGACLICLRGNTPLEEGLLNFAGMFAPVVALVPTRDFVKTCGSVPDMLNRHGVRAEVANDMFALLVVGGATLLIALVHRKRSRRLLPYLLAVALLLAAALFYALARNAFIRDAHYVAAVPMFVCIVGVALDNAVDYKKRAGKSLLNVYVAIAVAMAGAAVVILAVKAFVGWRYWLLALETAILALFAVFWLVQTWELGGRGLRAEV